VGRGIEASRERAALLLSTGRYESLPDAVVEDTFGIPRANTVRKRAPILEGLDYNVFSEAQAPEVPRETVRKASDASIA
jgi:hypothetical protein